ncbi:hypothetical protein HDU87_001627 [Geranomyces variabilis]|uniref:SAP domain-containing protein n=1 Tax=Geranomyces variabilis TaxID=109894 RepID=A0AAD5TMK2_9FUNG|nr:hypothetical protein HDU87_001627 [Geranomyces variabilis]
MANPPIKQMKVPELKAELVKAGLPTTGNKADLVARLLAHEAKEGAPVAATAPVSTTPAVAAAAVNVKPAPAAVVPETPKLASAAKPIDPSGKTDEELRRARAARFGIPLVEVKPGKETVTKSSAKSARAEAPKAAAPEKKAAAVSKANPQKLQVNIDPETLKRRQEKFGLAATSPVKTKTKSPAGVTAPEDPEKKRKREEEEEKMRKRAERFAINVLSTVGG